MSEAVMEEPAVKRGPGRPKKTNLEAQNERLDGSKATSTVSAENLYTGPMPQNADELKKAVQDFITMLYLCPHARILEREYPGNTPSDAMALKNYKTADQQFVRLGFVIPK